jgi:hypothetical protein
MIRWALIVLAITALAATVIVGHQVQEASAQSSQGISPLQRGIDSLGAGVGEQAQYYRLMGRAYNRAGRAALAGATVGRVGNLERRAIRSAVRATRLITTPGEAQGVRALLRPMARRS